MDPPSSGHTMACTMRDKGTNKSCHLTHSLARFWDRTEGRQCCCSFPLVVCMHVHVCTDRHNFGARHTVTKSEGENGWAWTGGYFRF
jgi:hypothetical protein